jgi:alanine racemase
VAKLHAAGTALLEEPDAWLDAVRPGLALYHDAVRVAAPLVEARDAAGPAGYGGFFPSTGRLGVIIGGYSDGMRAGATCLVNGQRRLIPEVGMQSAFVELGAGDTVGDEVVLLGDGITVQDVATAWGTSPHEMLYRLSRIGDRVYRS